MEPDNNIPNFFIDNQNELLIDGINGLNGTLKSAVQNANVLRNVLNNTMEDVNNLGSRISKYQSYDCTFVSEFN